MSGNSIWAAGPLCKMKSEERADIYPTIFTTQSPERDEIIPENPITLKEYSISVILREKNQKYICDGEKQH
jgi:hypothetical protein